MKTCTECLAEKPFRDFGRFSRAKDGLKSACLECSRLRARRDFARRKGSASPAQTVCVPCAECGQSFTKSSTNQKKVYCSRSCLSRAHESRRQVAAAHKPPRTCPCGNAVDTIVGYARCDGCKVDGRPRRTAYERNRTFQRYGVTQEWWDATLAGQGGRCAICRTGSPGRRGESWSIDHDHTHVLGDPAGVRGLLCSDCNLGIGQMGDDPARLFAAALYLERHQSLATPDRKAA